MDSFWMVWEGFTGEVAFRLNPEGWEEGSLAKRPENSIPGRGNSKHRGPEVEE